jgi:hypothetical protein
MINISTSVALYAHISSVGVRDNRSHVALSTEGLTSAETNKASRPGAGNEAGPPDAQTCELSTMTAEQIESISIRLSTLQAQIGDLLAAADSVHPVEPAAASELLTHRNDAISAAIAASSAESPLVRRFMNDGPRGAWGESAIGQLHQGYADTGFFAEHGGDLSIDCRRDTCQIDWAAPDLTGLTRAEADELLGIAHYELTALVARGVDNAGVMQMFPVADSATPGIRLVVAKADGS